MESRIDVKYTDKHSENSALGVVIGITFRVENEPRGIGLTSLDDASRSTGASALNNESRHRVDVEKQ